MSAASARLEDLLAGVREAVDARLPQLLAGPEPDPIDPLPAAARSALLSPGKRFRPASSSSPETSSAPRARACSTRPAPSRWYKSGVKTYLEVITAETDLRTSEINYYNALYQVLASKIDVQVALGQIVYYFLNHLFICCCIL